MLSELSDSDVRSHIGPHCMHALLSTLEPSEEQNQHLGWKGWKASISPGQGTFGDGPAAPLASTFSHPALADIFACGLWAPKGLEDLGSLFN